MLFEPSDPVDKPEAAATDCCAGDGPTEENGMGVGVGAVAEPAGEGAESCCAFVE